MEKTLSGIKWTIIERYSVQLTNIIVLLILVRLLTPSDFGLIAMIAFFTGLGNIFVESGFRSIIVEEKEIDNLKLVSIFWLNFSISIVLSFIFYHSNKLLSDFFHEPQLVQIVKSYWPVFILYAFQLLPYSILSKQLAFSKIAKKNLFSTIIAGFIAITLAYNGFSYWSLIFQSLSKQLFFCILLWMDFKFQFKFKINFKYLKSKFNLSFSILSNGLIGYFTENIDNMIIGKFYSSNTLGLYSKGYSIVQLPATNIKSVINKVAFPTMSAMLKEGNRIDSFYFKILKTILIFVTPLMLIVSLNAEAFTIYLFGEDWIELIPLIKYFAIGGIFYSINRLYLHVLILKDKPKLINLSTFLSKGAILFCMFIGLFFGILGVCIGRVIAELIGVVLSFFFLRDVFKVSIKSQLLQILPYILSGIIAFLFTFLLTNYALSGSLLQKSIFMIFTFLSIYFLSIYLLFRNELHFHLEVLMKIQKIILSK